MENIERRKTERARKEREKGDTPCFPAKPVYNNLQCINSGINLYHVPSVTYRCHEISGLGPPKFFSCSGIKLYVELRCVKLLSLV